MKKPSRKQLILEYLQKNIGEWVHNQELRDLTGLNDVPRTARLLRQEGWKIEVRGDGNIKLISLSLLAGDAEAIRHLEQEIAGGRHWYIALLEAMGMWGSAVESHHEMMYRYLIQEEAFDWLLLAERLCESVDGLLPVEEKETLLFQARPPVKLSPEEVKALIGQSKYRQYLNYFYGVTVEQALVMAVEEEVLKERRVSGFNNDADVSDEAYRRIYGETKQALLRCFRKKAGYLQKKSTTLAEMKELAYWLFKYRVEQCEHAKVASDTRKALEYLKQQWASEGIFGVLAAEDLSAGRPR